MFEAKDAPLDVGDQAPRFSLRNQDNVDVNLTDILARGPVVLFFYPKDNTRGCTAQACAFRDAYEVFAKEGASVLGISSDSTASHRHFADQNGFSYSLLSDPGERVRKLFGVPKSLYLIAGRVTYVLDASGIIRHVFNSQLNIKKHITEALTQVRALKAF